MESAHRRQREGRRNRMRNGIQTIKGGNPISIIERLSQLKSDKNSNVGLLANSIGESYSQNAPDDLHQTNSDTSNEHHPSFSSRNSLRSARTTDLSTNQQQQQLTPSNSLTKNMLNHIQVDQLRNLREHFCLDDSNNYEAFNSYLFIKRIGDFLYCILCGERRRFQRPNEDEIHLDSISHCEKLRHLRTMLLEQTPDDNSLHIRSVGLLLENWLCKYSLSKDNLDQRYYIVNEFNQLLQEINPECSCRIFGSLLDGTCLIESNINLELIHPNSILFESDPRSKNSIHHRLADPDANYGEQFNQHALHFDLIANASDTLFRTAVSIDNGFTSNRSFRVKSGLAEINSKVPRLDLLHEPSGTMVQVCCYTGISYKLSTLLNIYLSLDDRARDLSILVKHWAKLCDITSADKGTYSSDTYLIMVIYFLQRTEPPILPCLHEIVKSARSDSLSQEVDANTLSSQFNQLNILSNNTNGHSGGSGPEFDPENQHQQTREQLNDPVAEEADDDVEDDFDDAANEIGPEILDTLNWQSTNTDTIPKLFIDFLRFMSREFIDRGHVISIRTLRQIPVYAKKWTSTLKSIEHPIKPRLNISRCIASNRSFEFITNCFKHAYFYLTSMPIDIRLKQRQEQLNDPSDYVELYVNLNRLYFYFDMKESSFKSGPLKNSTLLEMIQQNIFSRDVDVINKLLEYISTNNLTINQLTKTLAGMYDSKYLVSLDKQAATFCWLCRRNAGHKKINCPKGKLSSLLAESRSYNSELDVRVNLDDAFYDLYSRDLITPELAERHEYVRSTLAKIIRFQTGLDCKLQLFGSTVNYLGTRDSDLDICMTIEGNPTGKDVDCVKILEQVLEVLTAREEVQEIEPILSARVPILKFKFNEFYVDLSMYNLCALHNSRLLRTYVLIDNRVAKLSYLVKRYAKACNIADASRGSLSSYAWSLLVVHFLQQVQPPILPVLQEANATSVRPFGVNGWNVWFNQDIESLQMEPNDYSMTELFKRFFVYYGTFDFNQYVISIRKSAKISKFQKNWNNCMMAIEDPFELTYNLSSRLDDPMAIYIINSFANTFRHIVNAQQQFLGPKSQWDDESRMSYLFNGNAIMGADPPVRGCKICHKIGHRFKDCPSASRNNAAGWTRRNNMPVRKPA